jgi:hypothetical protein
MHSPCQGARRQRTLAVALHVVSVRIVQHVIDKNKAVFEHLGEHEPRSRCLSTRPALLLNAVHVRNGLLRAARGRSRFPG